MWRSGRARSSVSISSFGDGLTEQDGARYDIKEVVKRATRGGGIVSGVSVREGSFTDISDAPTYQESLNIVARASTMFEALPAALRDRFNNDPIKLLAFLDNEDNRDEAIKLGLVKAPPEPPPPPEPMLVRVVDPEGSTK